MMAHYKYLRISTNQTKQNFKRQEKSLKKWEDENNVRCIEYSDECSGSDFNREEWQLLEDRLQSGDTVVFKDITRFTRNKTLGYHKYMELVQRGVKMVFIDNSNCNTEYIKSLLGTVKDDDELSILNLTMEYIAKLMLITELDRAEEQRKYISKAITDGINASAKKSGRPTGSLDKIKKYPKLKEDLIKYVTSREIKGIEIINKYGISRNTFHKYVNVVKVELNVQK